MAENILSAACQSVSPQQASASVPLSSQETEVFEDPSHPQKVLEGLNRLRLNSALCDVILCCEGQEFPCHRYVLASFSSYFEAMFTSGTRETTQERVSISGVEPHNVSLLVDYTYTSKLSISTANVKALLAASNMWDVAAVENACGDFMKRHMDEASTSVPLSTQETEVFEDPDHPEKVLDGLNRLRLNSALCDVILCCEGQEFPCHRYVLASFCSYFEAMFTSGMRETTQERVSISEVEPEIIGLLVNYAYTSKVSISTANVQALLAAANLWDVVAVRNARCDFMKHQMDRTNCVEIYYFSEDHSCEMLKKHSMDYILEHFSVIYQQQEFLALSVERLTEILASDHLNVPKEDMVFEAAIMWLDKCPTRRQSFDKVLEQIRLPLISPSYLPTVILCLDVVKEHEGCQRFISEAKERPYCNTARPRRPTVIVTVGEKCNKGGFEKVESFDPLTENWKTLGYLPFEVQQYAVVASGSTLYLAGGHRDESASKEMWRYDVHHNSWLKMAPMNMARYDFSLVEMDGYVFAVGGSGTKESKASIECYDPQNNTWKLMKSTVPVAYRKKALVVALERWLYFIGCVSVQGKDQTQLAKYHPVRSVWKKITPFEEPKLHDPSAACVLNGKIYVTGCRDWNCEMECYNPATNQWTRRSGAEERRYGQSMAVVDGKIYVLGGENLEFTEMNGPRDEDTFFNNIECYCEETDGWKAVDWRRTLHGYNCVTLRLRSDHVPVADDDDETSDDDCDYDYGDYCAEASDDDCDYDYGDYCAEAYQLPTTLENYW